MRTVREAVLGLLRAHGLTTIFGNPGSTELPFLAQLPADFRYVAGLQEATVVGIADGYAQASGRPALVNLHTAPGLGNAMGAIFNAQANKSPLVITAGQQHRSLMTMQANLTNRDATRVPHPFVKWSYEPPRAQDVPQALARAIALAQLPPRGPVFVSVGEGSAQYSIQALWTAAVERIPVTFLVLRNDEYAILKWFGLLENVGDAPGLDLPGLDCVALSRAYGVDARAVRETEELEGALRDAIACDLPGLIEVPVAPGMAIA